MPSTIKGDHSGVVRLDSRDNYPFVVLDNAPRVAYVHKNGEIERMKVGHYGFGTKKYNDEIIGKARSKYGLSISDDKPRKAGTAITNEDQVGVIIHEEQNKYIVHTGAKENGDWNFEKISKSTIGDEWVEYSESIIGQLCEKHNI